MRFLLVAPTADEIPRPADAAQVDAPSKGEARLRSSADFDAIELAQWWRDLPAGGQLAGKHGSPGMRVLRAAMCWSRGFSVLALEVEAAMSEGGPPPLAVLESWLTDAATEYATRHRLGEIAWAHRVAMTDEAALLPADWLGEDPVSVEVTTNGNDGGRPIVGILSVGWGNSLATGDLDAEERVWRHTVRGLVDAQTLWRELSWISEQATHATRANSIDGGAKRSEVTSFLHRLDELEAKKALHNLAFDELITVFGGPRRRAAEVALLSWGYERVHERVTQRLTDLASVAEKRAKTLDANYQRTVEGILFALGTVAVLEVALSLVGTAWSGAVDTVPGQGSSIPLLSAVREVGADSVITFAIVVLLLGALWLRRSRRE